MLAAGGYSSCVQLWDTRASTSPSVALPIPDKDAVTALSCSAATARVVAGTMSGRVCVWDLRKVYDRRPQVRHPSQAGHVESSSLVECNVVRTFCCTHCAMRLAELARRSWLNNICNVCK